LTQVLSENDFFKAYIAEAGKDIKSTDVLSVRLKADKYYNHLIERNHKSAAEMKKVQEKALFATCVMYRALLETFPDYAMGIIERGAATVAKEYGEKSIKFPKLPGMKTLYMTNIGRDCKKDFGPNAGFDTQFICTQKNFVQYDVKKCYIRQFCEEYGCPEIAHVFCMMELNEYGNVPGIGFTRTHSLVEDGEKCNFRFEHIIDIPDI